MTIPVEAIEDTEIIAWRPKLWLSPKGGYRARLKLNDTWRWYDAEKIGGGFWRVFLVDRELTNQPENALAS